MREVYFVPFEAVVKRAQTWEVLSSYNRLTTTFTSENVWLLNTVLRGDCGFDGVVMSDWFGSHSTAPTVKAGLDGKVRHEEGVFIGYRHHDRTGIPPLFPFGVGMSYSSFELSDLVVSGSEVSVSVADTGARAGSEVVQLYLTPAVASVLRPARELKSFVKVALQPGESRRVTLSLADRAFAWFDVDRQSWMVTPGDYGVEVGTSAIDLPLRGTIRKDAEILIAP